MLKRFSDFPIPFPIALAVMYIITAIAIIIRPNNTVNVMFESGFSNVAFASLLTLGAAILLGRPSLVWYVLSLIPLAIYSIFAITFVSRNNMPNAAVLVIYSIIITLFPLAYRVCRADGWQIYHVYGVALLPLAIAIYASPPLGAVGFIQENWGVLSQLTAIVIGGTTAIMLVTRSRRWFIVVLAIAALYTSAGIYGNLTQVDPITQASRPNLVGASINWLLLTTVTYTIMKTERYFTQQGGKDGVGT